MSGLTFEERRAMERFRDLEITIEQLRSALKRRVAFNFEPHGFYTRGITKHTDPAQPAVPVTLKHMREAYAAWKAKEIGTHDLCNWAAMLTMNDDYEINAVESEFICVWLNSMAATGEVGNIDPN